MLRDKVATIVPRAHLDVISQDKYMMALSYAADDPMYMDFFRHHADQGQHVILDNSTVEMGEPEPITSYVRKAVEMNATEILSPDWMDDAPRTLMAVPETLRTARKEGFGGRIMAVPQGNTVAEWRACADWMLSEFPIHTIGISRRYTTMFGGTRVNAVAEIMMLKGWSARSQDGVKIHLLGCWERPWNDIGGLLALPEVRGVDGSLASIFSMKGMRLTENAARPAVKIDILNDVYDDRIMRDNAEAWRSLCTRELQQ